MDEGVNMALMPYKFAETHLPGSQKIVWAFLDENVLETTAEKYYSRSIENIHRRDITEEAAHDTEYWDTFINSSFNENPRQAINLGTMKYSEEHRIIN